jgi:INO80 complex subunit E
VTRDRSYLLDRLLQYEKADCSSTESEDTESSDEEQIKTEGRKRKLEPGHSGIKNVPKKKRLGAPKKQQIINPPINHHHVTGNDEGLTAEEVNDLLESRLKTDVDYLGMIPSIPPPIVPTEMFSNEPSSESNEF